MRSVLLSAAMVSASSCTLVVLGDAAVTPPCEDDAECPAGSLCVEGLCQAASSGAVPPEGALLGPEGGVVIGPFGLEIVVPAGALATDTIFSVLPQTATTTVENFTPTGPFIEVDPAVTFLSPATMTLDGQGGLFRQVAAELAVWEAQPSAGASFVITQTGTFARGTAIEETP